MATKDSEAFVLMTYPLGEADKICVLFTREHGKVRAVAHGARRLKSRFGAGLEPLSEVSVSFYEKETRELVSLRACELISSAFEQAGTPEGEAFIHHLAELTDQFQPLSEPNRPVYRLLRATVTAFRLGSNPLALAAYFEVWLLKLDGFLAEWDRCTHCARSFDAQEVIRLAADGTPRCRGCGHSLATVVVPPGVRAAVKRLFRHSPAEWSSGADASHVVVLRQIIRKLIVNILERELKTELVLSVYRSDDRTGE